jgi:tRNA (guanine10-N2)-dimethyltransferase
VSQKYLFELGGENIELGKCEAIELLKTEKYEPKLVHDWENIIILDVLQEINKRVIRRLGMTKRVSKVLYYSNKHKLDKILEKIPIIDIKKKSFAIRLIKKNGISEKEIAIKLGEKIPKKNKIDLSKPDVKILYYSDKKTIISIWERNLQTYYTKCLKHHIRYRPFFSPIGIHPRISRSMVNLSNSMKGDKVIDPFCGTGGILIDIAHMQIEAIGIDILKKMVENSVGNLKHYNLKGLVVNGDINDIKNYKFKAIVTDPPYGLSTTTKGEGVKELMSRSMEIFRKTMKKEQRVVMAVSNPKLINLNDFTLIHKFEWYIHKSLTRYILVLERN